MSQNAKLESSRWLAQAEEEIKDAAGLINAGRYYLALFLCLQSAEKALKAFLYNREEDPIFSHSVAELLSLAVSLDPAFEAVTGAKRLDDYYIPTRYPNGLPGEIPARYYDNPEEAQRALGWSEKIIEMVKRKLT